MSAYSTFKSKKNLNSTKARLISFMNRHHLSTNSLPVHQKNQSLLVSNRELPDQHIEKVKRKAKLSHFQLPENKSPNLSNCKKKTRENSESPLTSFTTQLIEKNKIPSPEKVRQESPLITEFPSESFNSYETEKEKLKNKENELKLREQKLELKEKKFAKKKKKMFQEISKSLEVKFDEITLKEKKINDSLKRLSNEIEMLEKTKSEIFKMECSLFLNELIGSIVLNDYQEKIESLERENISENYIENEYPIFFDDFERIDEESNESSFECQNDSASFEYKSKKDLIIMNCIEITKENKEISDKLEEIIANLQPK